MEKLQAQILNKGITIWKILAVALGLFLIYTIGFHVAILLPIFAAVAICFPVPLSKIFHQASAAYFYAPPIEVIFFGGWVLFTIMFAVIFIR